MINVYISHAPADRKYVFKLLEWLRPLEQKYYLRIWFDHPEPAPVVPFPWNILFFWYNPPRSGRPYHKDLPQKVSEGHIYLFLTSQKAINTKWIEQDEAPTAVERYQRYGDRYIRVYTIDVSPSPWRHYSRLNGFPRMGLPGKAINQVKPEEEAYLAIVEQLRPVIEELRVNWMEETKRLGHPLDEFNKPALPWNEVPYRVVPLPNWIGWVVLFFLFWTVANYYADNCKPRYPQYWPKKEIPPEEFPRKVPNYPSNDTTVIPGERDTL